MPGRLFIFLLLLTTSTCLKVYGGPIYGIGLNKYNGVYWAHRKQILHLEAPTNGLELSLYMVPKQKEKSWLNNYKYPRIGVNLSYLYLGRDITGYAFGILPFVEFRIKEREKSELNLRMGTGIGYLTKTWDLQNNSQNIAIGSSLNANMRAHMIWHVYAFDGKGEFNVGAGITHYSNGNIKLPNLGVNSVELMIGLGWNSSSIRRGSDNVINDDTFAKTRGWEITLATGTKETNLIYNKQIYIFTPSVKYQWHYWPKSRLSTGIDMLFDKGYYYRDNPDDNLIPAVLADYFSISVKAGHELVLGKLSFISDIGAYIYSPGNFNGRIYQRLGFKYFFQEKWFGQISLKGHFSRADFFEWGFGYYISQ